MGLGLPFCNINGIIRFSEALSMLSIKDKSNYCQFQILKVITLPYNDLNKAFISDGKTTQLLYEFENPD